MEVDTFDRATSRVRAISSAGRGWGERNRRAWIWATVRLIPQRVPISPQWRMYCRCTEVKSGMSVLSVHTEYTAGEKTLSSGWPPAPLGAEAGSRQLEPRAHLHKPRPGLLPSHATPGQHPRPWLSRRPKKQKPRQGAARQPAAAGAT